MWQLGSPRPSTCISRLQQEGEPQERGGAGLVSEPEELVQLQKIEWWEEKDLNSLCLQANVEGRKISFNGSSSSSSPLKIIITETRRQACPATYSHTCLTLHAVPGQRDERLQRRGPQRAVMDGAVGSSLRQ